MSALVRPSRVFANLRHGGRQSVSGVVKRGNIVGPYRVVLFDRATFRPVASTWSASNGAYSFGYLAEFDAFVVAFDHTTPLLEAAIKDLAVFA
jgi:hypothetical protein